MLIESLNTNILFQSINLISRVGLGPHINHWVHSKIQLFQPGEDTFPFKAANIYSKSSFQIPVQSSHLILHSFYQCSLRASENTCFSHALRFVLARTTSSDGSALFCSLHPAAT